MSIEAVVQSNPLILCCLLVFLLSVFPSIRVFSKESALCIRLPKYWNFSFSISPSNEYSGLISFETESHSVMSDSLRPHGLHSLWNSPGQNTGVGSLSLLQGIFPTQGSNPGLLHYRWILYQLSHKESPVNCTSEPPGLGQGGSVPWWIWFLFCLDWALFTSSEGREKEPGLSSEILSLLLCPGLSRELPKPSGWGRVGTRKPAVPRLMA